MEMRSGKVTVSRAGGTAGKESKTYKLSLPSAWVNAIGLAEHGGRVILSFDGEAINVRPVQSMEEYRAARIEQGHELLEIRYYNCDCLCTLIYADRTAKDLLADEDAIELIKEGEEVFTLEHYESTKYKEKVNGKMVPKQCVRIRLK